MELTTPQMTGIIIGGALILLIVIGKGFAGVRVSVGS